MNHIKLIKSEQDHEAALERLMVLMDLDPAIGTVEFDEIDVLALLVEQYEAKEFPIDKPDPIEAIKFRMDQQGLKNKDLIPYIGSAPKVSEVLSGTRNLSLNMIRKLSDGLGISADILIQKPVQKSASEKAIDWLKFPIAEMRKRGYFEGFSSSLHELKEYAPEKLTEFLDSVSSGFKLQPEMLRSSAHLPSNNKETDQYALWAWQVRVLKLSAEQQLPLQYKPNTVTKEWMQSLAKLSWLERGPELAIEFLNKSGIHLIIEPHLPKTYLDGAVCFASDGNPVVALTLRRGYVDSFWFSLMHELAHIALHLERNEEWFLDDFDALGADRIEQEADALAKEAMISKDIWQECFPETAQDVRTLSNMLEISPCIIAGRARYESNQHQKFGTLFRDKLPACLLQKKMQYHC